MKHTRALLGGKVSDEGVWVIADVRRDLVRREEGVCLGVQLRFRRSRIEGGKKGGWRERRRERRRERGRE